MLNFRTANRKDLPKIINLLNDDKIASERESKNINTYEKAFEDILAQENNLIILGCIEDEVVSALQLTIIACLTHKGSTRAQIEMVRVSHAHRNKGIGKKIVEHAMLTARQKNCNIIQLTTNKKRSKAIHFYENIGFKNTHYGMKIFTPKNFIT
ncbi:MAG: GNAT family N-acetyltransferase [Rickettsiales bacterium]